MLQSRTSIPLTDLPVETLLHIANYLRFRLGLPTGALNKRLASIFRTPSSVAARALAHYKYPPTTLVYESWRSETDQHLVVKAILERVEWCDDDLLITINTPTNGPDGAIMTPLVAAACAGDTATVKVLLNAGATLARARLFVRVREARGFHLEMVKLLMNNGADTEEWLDEFLYKSTSSGRADVVRFLLTLGAKVNPRSRRHYHYPREDGPLQAAALGGHVEVVSMLLDHGADILFSDNMALWLAVREGKAAVVRLLLERGADAVGESEQAKNAMATADKRGFTDILDLLTLYSAEVL
ncbi:hypothetical protein HDU93_002336 [Gonapodya sp. JEL0774]|nr:hypothetical protein HDU93_002336 [Gonapodya sp. JEL0774]